MHEILKKTLVIMGKHRMGPCRECRDMVKVIEKLLEQKNRRIEELEERIAIMMEGNGYVEEETANHPGDVFTCEDPAEGRSEHAAGGGDDGRESGDGEPDEGGGV